MKPLDGLVVLDLTHVLAGPYCTKNLCDAGAEVIKIEHGTGDPYRYLEPTIKGESVLFTLMNGGKRGITLNLKTREGLEIIGKLVMKADVLVENLRPGSARKLGVDYQKLSKINPRLIYCSISGYGQYGPLKEKPGFDLIAEAESGLMGLTGERDGLPYKSGTFAADFAAGIYAAFGILLALAQREKTNKGQYIDTSLLDSMVAQSGMYAAFAFAGFPVSRNGNRDLFTPTGLYETKDGHIAIACVGDKIFADLCNALDLGTLLSDPTFSTPTARTKNLPQLTKILEGVLIRMETKEALLRLESVGVPCTVVVERIKDVLDNPQVRVRMMLPTVKHPRMGDVVLTGIPYKLSECELAPRYPAPLLGEHTNQVLSEMGYRAEEIREFREKKVI